MIISHAHRFIFIKTRKTAGTSLEVYLSQHCGPEDVITPIQPPVQGHRPRNHRGVRWPLRDLFVEGLGAPRRTLRNLFQLRAFHNHMDAAAVRRRVPRGVWDSYFKFCVERNPWDKTLSHYHMLRDRRGGELSLDDYFTAGRFCINHPLYTDPRGELLVDRVLRYENLAEELRHVFGKLGIPYKGSLGINAKGDHRVDRRPYQSVFKADERARIASIFAHELELLNYRF